MKAATRIIYGPPKVIEVKEIEKPTPKANEVLVKVMATTVNRTGCALLTGKPYIMRAFVGLFKPRDLVLGVDFAGIVEAIGSNVTSFKIGDRVWGLNDEGLQSQAEYLTISTKKAIVKMNDDVSFTDAAASAEGPHYARNFMTNLKLKPGDKVLLNGATGGIGSAALQMLKANGNYVTAVGNTKNLALLKSLGADKIYNYETEDFTKDDEKYDFVFDSVGKSQFSKCKPLMADGAVYISSELGPYAQNLYLPTLTKFSKKRVRFPFPFKPKKSLEYMNSLAAQGKYKPVIDRTYALKDIAEAYAFVLTGQKTGNVVIDMTL